MSAARPRSLRYVGVILAAGAFALAIRAWQGSSRDVTVRYTAPSGELTVTIRDDDGRRLRRVTFGEGAERQHALQLPDGEFSARLELPDRPARARTFTVEGDTAVELRWR